MHVSLLSVAVNSAALLLVFELSEGGTTHSNTSDFIPTQRFCLDRHGQGEVLCNETDSLPMTDEQRLYRRLRMNYDPFTRPVYNASQPVVVKIGITLTQIFDLSSNIINEGKKNEKERT